MPWLHRAERLDSGAVAVASGTSVFISYAHESSEHLAWVTYLAGQLEVMPEFNVVFDRYDLHAGHDLTHFMERGVAAERVLVVVTPQYVQKARERRGGVGYESSIISADVFRDQLSGRVVPALRMGDDVPDFLRSKVFADFRDDSAFDAAFADLTAALKGVTPVARPAKGAQITPLTTSVTHLNEPRASSPKPVVIASLPPTAEGALEHFGPIQVENVGERDAFNVDIADVSNRSQLARFDRIIHLRPGDKVDVAPVIQNVDETRNGFADLYKFAWAGQIGRTWKKLQEGERLDRDQIREDMERDFVMPVRISYHDAANQMWVSHCELVLGSNHAGYHRLTIQFRRVEPA
ncbi:MAG TPA: toll/interleukin-1 receptor domain-containing protein [Thermoanaerobaculia bacterium]|nr:toll/interleukin-1 receptor domain-containing protein [Thermoanaerobaculia bacterium]